MLYACHFEDTCIIHLQGQSWVNGITSCLMQKILNSKAYNGSGTCSELLQFGFNSHSNCSADNGFCTAILPNLYNWRCLLKVYGLSNFFNRNGIAEVSFLITCLWKFLTLCHVRTQVIETAKSCTQDQADNFSAKFATWSAISEELRNLLKAVNNSIGSKMSIKLMYKYKHQLYIYNNLYYNILIL